MAPDKGKGGAAAGDDVFDPPFPESPKKIDRIRRDPK